MLKSIGSVARNADIHCLGSTNAAHHADTTWEDGMTLAPTSPEGNEAYRKGLCKKCLTRPYQAGSPMCAECWPLRTETVIYRTVLWGNVTDEQRLIARAASNTRQANHEIHNDADYQIDPTKKRGNQVHYEFLIAGFGFHNNFGGPTPDLKLRRGGTRDSGLRVMLNGATRLVIPKANAYKGTDERLRVPKGTVVPEAIYVAARYHEVMDDCQLIGWETGAQLVAECDLRMWTHQINYTKSYLSLRDLKELGK